MTLFHVSTNNIGKEVTLMPFVSDEAHESECHVARVCAAPSVQQCVDGVYKMSKVWDNLKSAKACGFVYEILEPEKFAPNTSVFDFSLTGEHISMTPAKARLVGIIHFPLKPTYAYLNKEAMRFTPKGFFYEEIDGDIYSKYYL